MEKKIQKERIVDYIHQFGSITPLQAMTDLGVMRLASRIADLKKDGYLILTEREESKNRYGEKTSFSKYSIIE